MLIQKYGYEAAVTATVLSEEKEVFWSQSCQCNCEKERSSFRARPHRLCTNPIAVPTSAMGPKSVLEKKNKRFFGEY